MAGLGEFCAHAGALIYTIVIQIESEGISCTSRKNEWAVPKVQNVAPSPINKVYIF
jgi:hypothetical protein